MILEELLSPVLEFVLGSNVQTTVVLVLLIAILYFRKALGLGSILADWTGRLIFSLGVLLVLLVTGVIPGINIDALLGLLETGRELVLEAVATLA